MIRKTEELILESIIQNIVSALGGIPAELVVFIISLCPILELRGGLIAASILNVDMWRAIPICIIGNILPIPFILLFIEKIFDLLKNTRLVKMINKLEEKAEKGAAKIMKHKKWGLFLFVGIPLPGTGAWTGTLAASILDMDFKKTVTAVICGIALAAVIVSVVSALGFGAYVGITG